MNPFKIKHKFEENGFIRSDCLLVERSEDSLHIVITNDTNVSKNGEKTFGAAIRLTAEEATQLAVYLKYASQKKSRKCPCGHDVKSHSAQGCFFNYNCDCELSPEGI